MTGSGWDDYINTDPADLGAAVDDIQANVDDLANTVNNDPAASEQDLLAVTDAQASSYDAATQQGLADSNIAAGDYNAQQAQGWADWAAGSAAEGLDDLAANAYNTAAGYSGAAETSYGDAATEQGYVAADLQDTSTALSSLDTSVAASTSDYAETAAPVDYAESTDASAVEEA